MPIPDRTVRNAVTAAYHRRAEPLERQADYERAREARALSVEEFERELGLPPFSVYPAARAAFMPAHEGFFMYDAETRTEALAEDERQIRCLIALGLGLRDVGLLFGYSYKQLWHRFSRFSRPEAKTA